MVKIKYLEFLSRVAELTNYNEHTEARLLIANFFEIEAYKKIFKAILIIQEVEGYLPTEISLYRTIKTDNMIQAIGITEGLKIRNEVNSKL